jgi:hypothetical protein
MRKLFYAIVLFGLIGLSGCALNQMVKMAEDQNLTVSPNPLEVHADTVAFDMSANLPVKMLKKDKVYTVRTFYNYGEGEVELEPIQFRSEDYPNAKEESPEQSQSYSFPYSPEMNPGDLQVQGVASDPKNGKTKETPRMDVAPGIITTSKLVIPVSYATIADHGYNNQEELIPTRVNFYFNQGSSVLRSSERTGDMGQRLDAYIAGKNLTRTVTITGTHSPEGPERVNSDLAKNRAEAIEAFYRREMDKYDYEGKADSIQFILKDVVEDWTVFKDSLALYDGISSEEKSEWLNIINAGGTYEEVEDKLHTLSTYNQVFRELYPKLRTAKTEILTVKEKKTDAEIAALARQIVAGTVPADTLSAEEIRYAASMTPSLEEKEAIYKAAIQQDDSWNAHNNLAAAYIDMAIADPSRRAEYMDMAETQLEIAANQNPTAEVHANLASVALFNGNPYKAHDHVQKALAMSPSNEATQGLNGVKGAAEIMMADYEAAERSLSNATATPENTYNKALAQVLQRKWPQAFTTLRDEYDAQYGSDKNYVYARAYYLTAIVAARRQAGEDNVAQFLSEAVAADPSLKERALNDLEFRDYRDFQQFIDALK